MLTFNVICQYFVHVHPATVDGLVLWASYPAESNDLSARDVAVVSVYGSRDGLATPEKVTASEDLLPPETRWVEIEGGNHAQFGWYGAQNGDNPATISREAQTRQVVEATVELLANLEDQLTDRGYRFLSLELHPDSYPSRYTHHD